MTHSTGDELMEALAELRILFPERIAAGQSPQLLSTVSDHDDGAIPEWIPFAPRTEPVEVNVRSWMSTG